MVNLREMRLILEMSQEELAKECNVTRQAISNIERGIVVPSVDTAKAIGEALGFSWVLFFEDEKNLHAGAI